MFRFVFPLFSATILFGGTLNVFTAAGVNSPTMTLCALTNDHCVGSAPIPGTEMVLNYDTFGNADYGVLKSRSSASISGTLEGTPPNSAGVNTYARQRDSVKVTSLVPLPPGAPTTSLYFFAVTGFRTPTTVNSIARARLLYKNYSTGAEGVLLIQDPGLYTLEVPVRNDLYDDVEISLLTLVNLLSLEPGRSGASDYSATARLVGLGLKDSSGNRITSFTAVSETFGGTPGYLPTSVPEPGTMLSGIGLMTLLMLRRKKISK